jgi:hypothetical protein
MPRKQPIRDVLDRLNDGTAGIDSTTADDESTTAVQSADSDDDDDDDKCVIDDNDRWRLTVNKTVVNAIGPDYCCPAFYTTGSPSCLRAWGGEFECSINEVIDAYIERSETERSNTELDNEVREVLEDYTDSAMESYKDEETLRELYSDGLSQAQIAHQLDCSVHEVSRWMDEYGIQVGESSEHYSRHGELVGDKRTTPNDNDAEEELYRDEKTLRQLYDDGLTLQQIGDQLDQPPHLIYYWLDEYDIPEKGEDK